MEKLAEKVGEICSNGFRDLTGLVGLLLDECFEGLPPAVVPPNDVPLLLQSLQAGQQLLHLGEVGLVQPGAVELGLPAVLRVELCLEVDPLPQVTLTGQQQDRVEPVNDAGPASDAAGEKSSRHEEDDEFVGPVLAQPLVQSGRGPLQPAGAQGAAQRSAVVRMGQAG